MHSGFQTHSGRRMRLPAGPGTWLPYLYLLYSRHPVTICYSLDLLGPEFVCVVRFGPGLVCVVAHGQLWRSPIFGEHGTFLAHRNLDPNSRQPFHEQDLCMDQYPHFTPCLLIAGNRVVKYMYVSCTELRPGTYPCVQVHAIPI